MIANSSDKYNSPSSFNFFFRLRPLLLSKEEVSKNGTNKFNSYIFTSVSLIFTLKVLF